MWRITLGSKHQHGAHAGSAVTMSDHNVNRMANTLKLSLNIFYDSKIYMTMFKI